MASKILYSNYKDKIESLVSGTHSQSVSENDLANDAVVAFRCGLLTDSCFMFIEGESEAQEENIEGKAAINW